MNVLSMHALIGAYQPEGHAWVDELRQVLTQNVDYAYSYITSHFQGVELSRPQGTFMLFLDCTGWCRKHGKTIDQLQRAGWDVGWPGRRTAVPGTLPHPDESGPALSRIQEAMERLSKYVFCD